jgi:hypothetical protein
MANEKCTATVSHPSHVQMRAPFSVLSGRRQHELALRFRYLSDAQCQQLMRLEMHLNEEADGDAEARSKSFGG